MTTVNNASNKNYTVLLCGVGGQGTILAADLLAKTAIASGYKVKLSEIHGMSQRGGSVTTVVRFGPNPHSMVGDLGSADLIISFETTEAIRNLPFLKKGGALFVNDETIIPVTVNIGAATMPENPQDLLLSRGATMVPASDIARSAGSPKSTNVVLLGALSSSMDIPTQTWLEQIEKRVPPKTVEANKEAFIQGRKFAQSH